MILAVQNEGDVKSNVNNFVDDFGSASRDGDDILENKFILQTEFVSHLLGLMKSKEWEISNITGAKHICFPSR
jgi:hypothetical protein